MKLILNNFSTTFPTKVPKKGNKWKTFTFKFQNSVIIYTHTHTVSRDDNADDDDNAAATDDDDFSPFKRTDYSSTLIQIFVEELDNEKENKLSPHSNIG